MIKKIIVLLFLLSNITYSQNCNYTFSGKVIDLHDGSPLIGAIIVSSDSDVLVQTDMNGNFNITNLCKKTYVFNVSHPSCESRTYDIKISKNISKNLILEHHIEELNEVSVFGKSNDEKSKTLIENKISVETIDNYNSGSLGDILKNISGISSFNTGNTIIKPIINGLHSSRVVIINKGVKMEDQEWGTEHAPNIDINSIESLKLVKGAGLLEYSGDAIGGIIIAEASKVEKKDSLYGKTILSNSTNGRGSTISSRLTKSYSNGWYGSIQTTYKRYGDFESADYILTNTGIKEKNASFRLGFDKYTSGIELYISNFDNETGILKASHLHTAQDQLRGLKSSKPLIIDNFTYDINAPKQTYTHTLARLKGYKFYNNFGKLNFQYDFQRNRRFEYDIRRSAYRNLPSIDLNLKTHSVKFDLFSSLNSNLNMKIGILGRYQNNYPNPRTGVKRIIPDYDKFDFGFYSILDYFLNNNLTIESGVRFDYTHMDVFKFYNVSLWNLRNYDKKYSNLVLEEYNNQILINSKLNFSNLSATIGTRYNLKNNSKILFNYSLASRVPNPSELFSEGLHHSAARIELGDLSFKSELGHKLTFTYSYDGKKTSLSINPYANLIDNFILIEPTSIQQTIRGSFQVWEYRQTNAQLLGLDFDLKYKVNQKFNLENQFSLVKGYDVTLDEALINMPPVSIKNQIIYNNSKSNNLKLSFQSEYVFKQNEFPNNDFTVFIPQTERFELVELSTPPKAYHLLNFNSSIDLNIFKKTKMNLTFRINNLLNTSYRNYLNRLRYYSHELGRNFTLNIKFNY